MSDLHERVVEVLRQAASDGVIPVSPDKVFTHVYEPPCDHNGATRADTTCSWCGTTLDQAEWERVGVRQGWLPVASFEFEDEEFPATGSELGSETTP